MATLRLDYFGKIVEFKKITNRQSNARYQRIEFSPTSAILVSTNGAMKEYRESNNKIDLKDLFSKNLT